MRKKRNWLLDFFEDIHYILYIFILLSSIILCKQDAREIEIYACGPWALGKMSYEAKERDHHGPDSVTLCHYSNMEDLTEMIEERTSFTVGEEATLSRIISDEDIKTFARISGDENPVHINDDYAKGTVFGSRIAHGMLAASLISSVLGNVLPGPGAVYVSQQLRFLAPVRPGDQVTARVKVAKWDPDNGLVILTTEVINEKDVAVISGKAVLVMSSHMT